ncbi:Crp/Fnr family transcriptional regulator [Bacillus sp. KH172YL63]|uniref:Crp/Fnr family transcriptional regulator n=1 Tax=Bacillus sp. KH172YL63 TaxID=2709784 RepID=UPI0013E499FD|nr:Crp/Fnr family transcriptional regulator [Bacillus sp. KH172YL63]BCB05550.1 transcriptional regulator [Bacillus sp. KH172YL63]
MNSATQYQVSAVEELPAKLMTYGKKDIIFQPYSFGKNLYMIESGKIKLFKNSDDGRSTILAVLGEGDFFSNIERFSLDDEGVFAQAIEPTNVRVLSQKQVDSLHVTHPAVLTELYLVLHRHMKERNMFLERIMYVPVKERILHLMSFLMKSFGESEGKLIKIHVPLTHQDIASFIGSTRETVTSLTKELITEGTLKKIDKHYHMLLEAGS